MLNHQFKATEKTFWIAYNDDNVIHSGELEKDEEIDSGLPFFEVFTSRREWNKRLIELGKRIV